MRSSGWAPIRLLQHRHLGRGHLGDRAGVPAAPLGTDDTIAPAGKPRLCDEDRRGLSGHRPGRAAVRLAGWELPEMASAGMFF